MENTAVVTNCVEFKHELHQKLYKESGAGNFDDYIKYINSHYSDTRVPSGAPNNMVR